MIGILIGLFVFSMFFGFAGALDAFKWPEAAWDEVRLHRTAVAVMLGLATFLVAFVPVPLYYWLRLRWRLKAATARIEEQQRERRRAAAASQVGGGSLA